MRLLDKTLAKITQHPPLVANVLAFSLIAILLSKLAIQLSELLIDEPLVLYTQTESNDALLKPPVQNNDVQIASMHLFGLPETEINSGANDKSITAAADAPVSPLNLTLMGIAAQTVKIKSRAIILNNNTNREELFAINDNVFDLAILQEVYDNRILLRRNGNMETLHLQKTSLQNIVQNTYSHETHINATSEFINHLVEQQDASMQNAIQLDTVYSKGEIIGYSLSIKQPDENGVIQKLGLEDNDLITLITSSNGSSFSEMRMGNLSEIDPGKIMTAELEIQRGSSLHIVFLENDTTQQISQSTFLDDDPDDSLSPEDLLSDPAFE